MTTTRTPHDASLFIAYAQAGGLEQVQAMLASGMPVDTIGFDSRTALYAAVEGGHIPVMRALLDAGADPNQLTMHGSGRFDQKTTRVP